MKKIAIVGEFYEGFTPHTTIVESINHIKQKHIIDIEAQWVDTLQVEKEGDKLLSQYDGFWSAPGSPFKSLEGALKAIEFSRLHDIPHLGTCAGFQHAVIEFARNVLGIKEAMHEEYDNEASVLFVNKLVCSLAGKTMKVTLKQPSLAYDCYNSSETVENYYCNFGINPEFKNQLEHEELRISGTDQDNEIRIIEIPKNRFFVSTLFVPQSKSSVEKPHPIIERFILECVK